VSHDFAERVNFSHGVALDEGIISHLLATIPNATGARRTESSSIDDRSGTDLWIDRRGLPSVSVDFKHRERNYDDICIETWSVDRPGKKPIIGWTMDRDKRTDLVVYTWPTETAARRFWIAWFPFLCRAAWRNARGWAVRFPYRSTSSQDDLRGFYRTWFVCVPREVVELAMREIMQGQI
jgi:hypothetical protein